MCTDNNKRDSYPKVPYSLPSVRDFPAYISVVWVLNHFFFLGNFFRADTSVVRPHFSGHPTLYISLDESRMGNFNAILDKINKEIIATLLLWQLICFLVVIFSISIT